MKPKKIEKIIYRVFYSNFYCLLSPQRIPFPQPVTMEAPISEVLPKSKIELYREQKAAEKARLAEERELELELAKNKLEDIKQEKAHKEAMDKLAKEMASLRPPYAAVAAAGGGDEEWGAEPKHHAAIGAAGGGAEDEHIDKEAVMYKLYGFCNDFINGMECHGRCPYTHPEVEFKPNEYNFPKKLQTMPDGSSRDYRLMGFCVHTLNGRHCKNNRCRYTHPEGYQNGEMPAGKKRELGAFRKGYPNFPTA